VPVHDITRTILVLRGQRVLLDAELASLYGVTTKRLNEQVRRNLDRFPADFMFQLTAAEATALRSQIATSNTGRGGRRCLPYAFTDLRRATEQRTFPISLNAASGLALRKLEHLVLLQQRIHGFPKQILLGPTVSFRELVQ
jgi:hypothetical protein